MPLAPWKFGRLLVWDATYPDSFAPSYRALATQAAGMVAAGAEEGKIVKYRCLPPSHSFTPLAVESLGAVGPVSLALVCEFEETGDPRSFDFILQRLAIIVQQGNCTSVMGSAAQ